MTKDSRVGTKENTQWD